MISVTCETMNMTVNMTLGMKTLAVDILKVKWHDFLYTVTGCYTYNNILLYTVLAILNTCWKGTCISYFLSGLVA